MEVTIIIPIHNGETTLKDVFSLLESQSTKEVIKEIILIDDGSTDSSRDMIRKYQKCSSYHLKLILHEKPEGLAAGYNEGIRLSNTDYFILMHQDVILVDQNSLIKIVEPFYTKTDVVATCPTILHPYEVWSKYNFWQKCLFSRHVDTKKSGNNGIFDGKFNCLRKTGVYFDSETYKTAEEYFDYIQKIKPHGKIESVDLGVVHLHNTDKQFRLTDWLRKEAQLAEGYGVNVRKYHKNIGLKSYALLLFRPTVLVTLFINYYFIDGISIILIVLFCFYYTKLVYIKCYKNPKIILLPFINFVTLIVYSFYFTKGFLYKKQTL